LGAASPAQISGTLENSRWRAHCPGLEVLLQSSQLDFHQDKVRQPMGCSFDTHGSSHKAPWDYTVVLRS
jgi:hypothetical protein